MSEGQEVGGVEGGDVLSAPPLLVRERDYTPKEGEVRRESST